ncbi:MAG: molybdenum transporter ATP-binding protein [Glaciihabitans sp.]|nr:molybdenum transporter ATP-binding protein [Glaciihabitans sp.]
MSDFSATMRLAARNVDLRIEVAAGETVAVLGPNGAGKSTVLDVIAGLVTPDSGHSELAGEVLFNLPAGGKSPPAWKPPHQRAVSLLAQEALLFPHLTVLENVAFGPRSAGVGAKRAREMAVQWLREVDAEQLGARKPAELSGGQAQRIAVARALASDPGLLLLDEPMAALDISVAPAIRRMLRRVLADRSAIIVTHDALDAYTLADRVVIVEEGRVVDQGTPAEVFDRPRSAFVAGLAGVNLLTGIREGNSLVLDDGGPVIPLGGFAGSGGFTGFDRFDRFGGVADVPVGVPLSLAVRPAAVTVSLAEPTNPSVLAFRAPMIDLEPRGDSVRVRGSLLAADVSPRDAAALDATVDSMLWFSFAPQAATVYPTAHVRVIDE